MHPALVAVGQLIKQQTMTIQVTTTIAYTAHAPCLLQQLHEAVAGGLESGGRGVPGSRPPIAVAALDLWVEIGLSVGVWAELLKIPAATYPDTEHTPAVGRLLRGCAAQAISTGKEPVVEAIHRNAATWARSIIDMLSGRPEHHGVRGATCPTCGISTVLEIRPEDGRQQRYRVPAIIVTSWESLRWVCCQGCGWSHQLGADLPASLDTVPAQAA